MKRKMLALFLAVTVSTGLFSGCGCSTGENGNNNNTDGNNTEQEVIKATLTVWSPAEDQSTASGEWLQSRCEEFDELHPEWELAFQYGVCSEADAKPTITQDVEGAADVYMFANDQIPDLVSMNAIAKLGGETAEAVQQNNDEVIVNSVTVDGNVYGVPFTPNTWFLYYDKSVFSEEDITSLESMLKKGKVAFPLTTGWYNASFFVSNDCLLFGEDGTDNEAGFEFSGVKALEATNYMIDLAANPNFVNDSDGSGLSGLRNGSVHAMFSGSWDAAAIKEALGDNFGVAKLPTINIGGENKQLKSFAGSKAIGVNPHCENPQIAVALAAFLGNKESQRSHYELRNVIPSHTGLLEDNKISSDPVVKAQRDTIANTSVTQPVVKNMGNYWTPGEHFGKSIINGEITKDNVAEMTEKMNASLNSSIVE